MSKTRIAMLAMIAWCGVSAASATETAGAPSAKFFPINPTAYTRPALQRPVGNLHFAPTAGRLPQKFIRSAPIASAPSALSSPGDEQARQLLSIYPVQN